jgi:hypothetical protein
MKLRRHSSEKDWDKDGRLRGYPILSPTCGVSNPQDGFVPKSLAGIFDIPWLPVHEYSVEHC